MEIMSERKRCYVMTLTQKGPCPKICHVVSAQLMNVKNLAVADGSVVIHPPGIRVKRTDRTALRQLQGPHSLVGTRYSAFTQQRHPAEFARKFVYTSRATPQSSRCSPRRRNRCARGVQGASAYSPGGTSTWEAALNWHTSSELQSRRIWCRCHLRCNINSRC